VTTLATDPDQVTSGANLIVKEWYYQSGSHYLGPVSQPEIWVLHGMGQVKDNTLVWSAIQGGDWRPLRDTDVGRPLAAPPSLPGPRYSSVFAWVMTVIPIVGLGVEALTYSLNPQLDIPPIGILAGYGLAYGILAALDMTSIRQTGPDRETAALTWGLLFAPLYLLLRARATKTFPTQLIVWTALVISTEFVRTIL
jgi:hypothetical protein